MWKMYKVYCMKDRQYLDSLTGLQLYLSAPLAAVAKENP